LNRLFFAFLLLFIHSPALSKSRISETIIKVGVLSAQKNVHVKCFENLRVVDINLLDKIDLNPDRDYIVRAYGDGIKVGEHEFTDQVRFIPMEDNSFLYINGRRYRDTVMITSDGKALTVVNELGIDGYLFGVLPVEVSPEWDAEALKAQAIVSRTYVLNNLGKYESKGYDLSNDIFSQMYRGVEVENPSSNSAVLETEGIVLLYEGELAKAYFHSSCGGYTADIGKVWTAPLEYMRGVTCPYCRESPRYHWEIEISKQDLKEKLAAGGYETGDIEDIKFLSRSESGRIQDMYIMHSGRELMITGHKFRMAVGPNVIKSTLMTVDRSGPQFRFYGRGWGHGVGMCQWGARGLAMRGKNYKQILRFYFSGTKVKKWY
jgi:stage II sporulation protein D